MKDYKHLLPAVAYEKEIKEESNKLRYSQKMMYYNGTSEHGPIYIENDWTNGKYQWAIVDNDKKLVGYIAYNIDKASKNVYSFGLISFTNDKLSMMCGIREVIDHLECTNAHRIEWRCVSDNPARERYLKILKRYNGKSFRLTDVFIDENGIYHDEDLFEIIIK